MRDHPQLPLDLGLAPRFGREDFLVSQSNADAYGWIEIWPDWPSRMLLLMGPSAAGKSHLAAIWAQDAKAMIVPAKALKAADLPALLTSGAAVIEDIDVDDRDEAALFHLINLAQEQNAFLLLTTRKALPEIVIATPDLLSRLRKLPLVSIASPDDALIRALLVKLFVDRQLVVDTALVDYLCPRIERSFAGVNQIVEKLDRETLARGKRLTRSMAAKIHGLVGE